MSAKQWTPLSYARAKGKYGLCGERGIYPEDVLKYYGAKVYGAQPEAPGARSPRESYNPEAEAFGRERGSYQARAHARGARRSERARSRAWRGRARGAHAGRRRSRSTRERRTLRGEGRVRRGRGEGGPPRACARVERNITRSRL